MLKCHLMEMERMKKLGKKKIINAAALGLSLLMAPSLVAGSALTAYASPTITADEQNAIDSFLATHPVDGDRATIDTTNPIPAAPITYTFPGPDNYVSVLTAKNQEMRLTQDRTFTVRYSNTSYETITAKVKDWSTVVWHKIYDTPEFLAGRGRYGSHRYYFARKVTVINQDDNSEIVLDYPILDLNLGEINPHHIVSGIYPDVPVEAEDPRFKLSFENGNAEEAGVFAYSSGYWGFDVEFEEEYSYDTIIQVDESLKMNETVVTDGSFGLKESTVNVGGSYKIAPEIAYQEFRQHTADDVYNHLKERFDNATVDNPVFYGDYSWAGYYGEAHFTASVDRIIRVGIDYTHYVAEDGTELQPKVYGLQAVENFAGYEYVSTHEEANGDRVHVYKKVVSTPSKSSSPKTGDTNLRNFMAILIVGMLGSMAAFITRNKNI